MKDLGATKWPEMLFGAWLVTFLFSPSEVRSLVSGGTVGNFGLTLGLSPAEMWMVVMRHDVLAHQIFLGGC